VKGDHQGQKPKERGDERELGKQRIKRFRERGKTYLPMGKEKKEEVR